MRWGDIAERIGKDIRCALGPPRTVEEYELYGYVKNYDEQEAKNHMISSELVPSPSSKSLSRPL
jgi:hypothetical protein